MSFPGSMEPPPDSIDDRPVLTTLPGSPKASIPGLGARSGRATAPSPAAAKDSEPACRAAAGLRSNKSYCP
jgi:hypothetical protein